VQFESRLDHII